MNNRIKKIIRETIDSYILNEDKTVTFGGQINPHYGWAVLICGAPGVGKSSAARMHIPINGKVLTPDYFRETLAYYLNRKEYKNGDKALTYDLSTSQGNKAINGMRGISGDDSFYSQLVKNISNANKNQNILPNLIFDTTGTNPRTISFIFNTLKKMGGYKISVVWVLSNREVAYVSNVGKERTINVNQFHKGHNAVMGSRIHPNLMSIQDLLDDNSNMIDEAWMIVNSSFDDIDGERIQRRPNEIENQSNVIKLQKVGDSFQIPRILGTDDKKPFLGGKKDVSLYDILGNEVPFKGKGQFAKPIGYPSIGTVKKNAAKDPNNYGLPNVAVKFNQNDVDKRKNDELRRIKFSKMSPEAKKRYLDSMNQKGIDTSNLKNGMRHSSLM
jgi:hypothetical protein